MHVVLVALPIVALVAALAATLALVLRVGAREASGSTRALALALTLVTALTLAAVGPWRDRPPALEPAVAVAPSGGYVGSDACRACHPKEHASFARTFHRTMSQRASPATVRARLSGEPLEDRGRVARLFTRDRSVWAELPDPDVEAEAALAAQRAEVRAATRAPLVEREVVLVTGSHREQAYWVRGRRAGELRLFPFVWLLDDGRFVARRDAFLRPPDEPMPPARWNSNCIACHAVAGRPAHDEVRDAFDTTVAELGIACEACHGPGAAHRQRHASPAVRWRARRSDEADPTIVQPRNLAPRAQVHLCGQCHSYAVPKDEERFWVDGYATTFRPGELLDATRTLLFPGAFATPDRPRPDLPFVATSIDSLFWPDGTIRVGGREANGLIASRCFGDGEGARTITCLDCHSMHDAPPAAQLVANQAEQGACVRCHGSMGGTAHTRHREGSSASRCVSCHMPRTSYALFAATRSHRIASPRDAAPGEVPSACVTCHADRSRSWIAGELARRRDPSLAQPAEERGAEAQGVATALRGDAAERVVMAHALGTADTLEVVGADFAARVLAELVVDRYAAVREVARRSVRRLPDYNDLAGPRDRIAAAAEALRAALLARFDARAASSPGADALRRALLVGEDGARDDAWVRAALAAQNTRAITIAE